MACIASMPPRSGKECRAILQKMDMINPVIALMLEFSALTGLRYSDVSVLKFTEVYINGVLRDDLVVVQSKPFNKRLAANVSKAKAREASKITIHINDQCKAVIEDVRRLNEGKALLFESSIRKGKPFTAQYVNKLLKVVALDLKLNYPLSTHSFRKSFAMFIINNNARIHQVRDALGQASLTSTDAYLKTFMSDTKKLTDKVSF